MGKSSGQKKNVTIINSLEIDLLTDDIIITAYDTDKRKRLIIDGIHRASILTNECDVEFSPVKIYECYGSWL